MNKGNRQKALNCCLRLQLAPRLPRAKANPHREILREWTLDWVVLRGEDSGKNLGLEELSRQDFMAENKEMHTLHSLCRLGPQSGRKPPSSTGRPLSPQDYDGKNPVFFIKTSDSLLVVCPIIAHPFGILLILEAQGIHFKRTILSLCVCVCVRERERERKLCKKQAD
jgi:hypothetical protein